MPKKIKQEDTDLYKKLLVGFSFGQLVLGFLCRHQPADHRRPVGDQHRLHDIGQSLLGG